MSTAQIISLIFAIIVAGGFIYLMFDNINLKKSK